MLLLLLGFIPEHFEEHGYASLAFLAASAGLFYIFERYAEGSYKAGKPYSAFILGLLLLIHALADGIGLAITSYAPFSISSHNNSYLEYAILLHRLPVSIGIWTFLYPRFNLKVPVTLCLIVSIGTIVGYWIGAKGLFKVDHSHIHTLEYLIAGGLIHLGTHAIRSKNHIKVVRKYL